jgi:hypothetical protein
MSTQAMTTSVQKPKKPSRFPWKYFDHTTLSPYDAAAQLASVTASVGLIIQLVGSS